MSINLAEVTPDFILELKELRRGPFDVFLLGPSEGDDSKALFRMRGAKNNNGIDILGVDLSDDEHNRMTFCGKGVGNYCFTFPLSAFLKLQSKPGAITGECGLVGGQECGGCTLSTPGLK